MRKFQTRWWLEADKRLEEGKPDVSGAGQKSRRPETTSAWNGQMHRQLEVEEELLEEGGCSARGSMGHNVDNMGRDGSLVGSERGDAGSPDAVAA